MFTDYTPADDPLISVIVPVYNAEALIAGTLASALNQSYRNIEVIVVDDGSTDNTAKIVAETASSDPRVQLIRQQNAGVAAARNAAIKAARGSLIAPLDSDDLWHPEKLARQAEVMRRSGPQVGLVYCWAARIDDAGRVLTVPGKITLEGAVLAPLVYSNFIPCASIPLIRRACLVEAGGYDPVLRALRAEGCEDWKLYCRIAERYDFAVVQANLVGYRITAASMSQDVVQMARSYRIVLRDVQQRNPELPDEIFRWSDAKFGRYLAARAFGQRRPQIATPMLLRALMLDPLLTIEQALNFGAKRARQGRHCEMQRMEAYKGLPFESLDPAQTETRKVGRVAIRRAALMAALESSRRRRLGRSNRQLAFQTHHSTEP